MSERKIKGSEEVPWFPGANLQGKGRTQSPKKMRFSLGTRASVFSWNKDFGGGYYWKTNSIVTIYIYIYISKI